MTPFLDRLPVETRLEIYRYLLQSEKALTSRYREDDIEEVIDDPVTTSILPVCEQIYAEALPIFFEINKIRLSHSDFCVKHEPDRWPTSSNMAELRHVEIKWIGRPHAGSNPDCLHCLQGFGVLAKRIQDYGSDHFPHLRTFTIRLDIWNARFDLVGQLDRAGLIVTSPEVRVLEVVSACKPLIRFTIPKMVKAWRK